jgi:hypothetical protein
MFSSHIPHCHLNLNRIPYHFGLSSDALSFRTFFRRILQTSYVFPEKTINLRTLTAYLLTLLDSIYTGTSCGAWGHNTLHVTYVSTIFAYSQVAGARCLDAVCVVGPLACPPPPLTPPIRRPWAAMKQAQHSR